jgi:hemolysin activation/secretion protein
VKSIPKQFLLFLLALSVTTASVYARASDDVLTFAIKAFVVDGNTLFPDDKVLQVLEPFSGSNKAAEDVEQARKALESFYHKEGYPSVLVNIPEQTVEEGIVKLEVVESKIRKVKVTGNRYFTKEKILKDLPSFSPGEILYLPRVQKELNRMNTSPDLKVAPVLMPGREFGTIDVELKVKDRLPLHGSLEVNNRSAHNTTDLRLNALIRYDNLWQKEHSVSLQYQTSPEDLDEVQVAAGSYVLPAPWHQDHMLALYGILSDSDTAFGEGFQALGKGKIYGARYVMPLPPYKTYAHNITAGIDYKDFDEEVGFGEEAEALKTPITYLPLTFSYNASLPDSWGWSRFSASASMAFRGLVTDQREFEIKRFQATGNYLFATAGVERTQKLPGGMSLFLKLDGQLADQPLISNEQYSAGGMESVRGYKEVEQLGDNAFHTTMELASPDLTDLFGFPDKLNVTPYLFYDFATLSLIDPLPGEDRSVSLNGIGGGVRGSVAHHVEFQLDWAVALSDTDRTEKGESRVYFRIKAKF